MGLWLLQESLRTWELDGHAGEPAGAAHRRGRAARRAGRSSSRTTRRSCRRATCRPGSPPPAVAAGPARAGERAPGSSAAILDSLAAAFGRAVRDAARLSGQPVEVVHLVGGGARNTLLCQLTADACELPVAGRAGRGDRARQRPGPGPRARAPARATSRRSGRSSAAPRTSGATSRGPRRPGAEPDAMRIALFITCYNDLLFPEVGQAMVTAPAAARPRGRVPGRARRAAARCTSTRATRTPASRSSSGFVDAFAGLRRRRHAVGLVRLDGPSPPRARRAACPGRRRPARRASPRSRRGCSS